MTAWAIPLVRDGAVLHIDDAGGEGQAVVFQHGLGGDALQTAEVFPSDRHVRRITLVCRGHGASESGPRAALSIAAFTDDVAALIERSGSPPLVVGGISMGAAIALRLAVLRPALVRGLVLARPAWVTEAAPVTMRPNAEVGRLLATLPADQARAAFAASGTWRDLARDAPDNLASLEGFFARSPQEVTAALLRAIAADGPGVSPDDVGRIAVPTLVIGHARDTIHPLSYAERLATMIPGARLAVVTPKADDRARHVADCRRAILAFLTESFS